MDADRFAKYWGDSTPRMHIPGFTHPVQDFTLEDVLDLTGYIPPKKKKKQSQYSRGGGGGSYQIQPSFVDGDDFGDEGDNPAEKDTASTQTGCVVPLEERLNRMNEDQIDYDLIAVLVKTLLQGKEDDGSILVFLPGASDLLEDELCALLLSHRFRGLIVCHFFVLMRLPFIASVVTVIFRCW